MAVAHPYIQQTITQQNKHTLTHKRMQKYFAKHKTYCPETLYYKPSTCG